MSKSYIVIFNTSIDRISSTSNYIEKLNDGDISIFYKLKQLLLNDLEIINKIIENKNDIQSISDNYNILTINSKNSINFPENLIYESYGDESSGLNSNMINEIELLGELEENTKRILV